MTRSPLQDPIPYWPHIPEAERTAEFLRFLHWWDWVARQSDGDAIRSVWEAS